ncbi:PAS domain-containing sensor histidine kinase [Sphingomonas crocodyli]|nr:ATP-binding protein [Sphingomonas crocodyli]
MRGSLTLDAQTVGDLVSDAIIGCDESGRIAFWNDGATLLYGWPREQALGRDMDELLAMPKSPELAERWRVGRWEGECGRRQADGSAIDVSVRQQVHLADGDGAYLWEWSRRIPTPALAETSFSHAARISILGELTASIAHELNQPLAAILAFAQASLRWIERPEPEPAEAAILLHDIVADTRRASEIITRIRSMATKHDPAPQPIAINDLIGDALLIVRHECLERGVAVRTAFADALPLVMADRIQLQQVIVNLAINAVQAMAERRGGDRHLIVTTQAAGGTILIQVDDSGPGIAAVDQDQIFSSFFTTKSGGMGMGLPICRSIVQAHGGRITAENRADGARFSVTLPALV